MGKALLERYLPEMEDSGSELHIKRGLYRFGEESSNELEQPGTEKGRTT
jgi:hypothetical protein